MRRIAIGEDLNLVARDLGFSPQSVRSVIKSPFFQQELQEMQAKLDKATYDAMRELRGLQPDAVTTLRQLVKNKKRPDLRLAAAREILNRTGINAPAQVEISRTEHISYEQRLQIATDDKPKQIDYIDSEVTVLSGEELEKTDDKSDIITESTGSTEPTGDSGELNDQTSS